jgi:alkylation response protein AidB-like acyl-CoA dehydrogenase
VIEEISRYDASAGWVAMIGSDGGYYGAFLQPDVAREVFPDIDAVTAGYVTPAGRAAPAGGRLRVDGTWPFGSGSAHASRFASGVLVEGPKPEWRVAVLERAQVEVEPTWDAIGLRGSSSHHYAATGVEVPWERTFSFADGAYLDGPLYRFAGMFMVNVPGVPLGVGRSALDEAYRVLEDKRRPAQTAVRDEPRVQAALARAEGALASARLLLHDAVGRLWSTLVSGDPLPLRQRADVWIATAHAFATAREVVGTAVEVAGSTACYASCPLQRHLRDVTAMCGHVLAQPRAFETAGRMLLGEEPPIPVL